MKPGAMRIKSFFAPTVDQAMAQARLELGADALLLNTRRLVENGKSSGYEVVMGLSNLPETAEDKSNLPAPEIAVDSASSELAKLRRQMDEIQTLLLQSAQNQLLNSRTTPMLAELHARLLSAHVDPILSKDIVDRLEADLATDAFFREVGPGAAANQWKRVRPDPSHLETQFRAELERRVPILAGLGTGKGSIGPVAVLVGPTGGGKSTSIAKLAIATSAHMPVRLISLDRSRPGASQHLQALASGTGIAFSAEEALDQLPAVLAAARTKECVLIDTPGFSARDERGAQALADTLIHCPEIDVHLAVPAYMSQVDFRSAIERYLRFKPAKLLVTKLDESQNLGTAFSEAARAGLALSFLTDGPRVPEDIRSASGDDLVAMVVERPRARAQHAA